ncbi:hypothetical protein F3Y22_tig00117000pilonHSYRG00053 [Hibiscus syriacus]|uniref:PB1 domain-containing protein n=1 Tax=Hibiscus syriacus TaxID=106335 RepID=A0A6A2WEE3_HIBSY|nr:hypothetical protein F3Y22_tig00117000pilonHSYRG00053 [Hibiscus syriacus]
MAANHTAFDVNIVFEYGNLEASIGVQTAGSVRRSIDATSFKNYDELTSSIEFMLGLKGLPEGPRVSGWKSAYVDYETEVLLVGDDPWEEFVGCVHCIRNLEFYPLRTDEEWMKLLNSAAMQGINGSNS